MNRPVPPSEPSPEECCQSGCDPCVFDRYNDELREYRLALARWEQQQSAATAIEPEEKQP